MIAKQIIEKYKLTPCPFCNGEVKIVVCDDEGNDHNDDYENDPWSGLGYKLRHTGEDVPNGVECPIATHDGEDLGKLIYDTREEAATIWNSRIS